jgi:dolichyl-phosphate beta-glucosyltransferase
MTTASLASQSAIELHENLFLSVVIPAFNEAQRIGDTVDQVISYLDSRWKRWELIIVDDGSGDGTASVVRNRFPQLTRIRLIVNSKNCGKGYAVRTGMLAAEGDLILFSDADLSAPIQELENLLLPVRQGYHVAIGSRALRRELIMARQSRWRESAGLAFNFALQFITGLKFHDTQCGFKLFRREAARKVFARQQVWSFGFDAEILYLAKKYGFRSIEVPVRWAHSDGSKVHVLRDGLTMVCDLFRIRLNDLAGRYSDSAGTVDTVIP